MGGQNKHSYPSHDGYTEQDRHEPHIDYLRPVSRRFQDYCREEPIRLTCDSDAMVLLAGAHDETGHAPWHFLNFFPDPHGQGSFRPTFSWPRTTCCTCGVSPAPAMRASSSSRRFRRLNSSSSSSTEVETMRGGRRPFPSPPCCAGTAESGPCPEGAVGGDPSCVRPPAPASGGLSRICIR